RTLCHLFMAVVCGLLSGCGAPTGQETPFVTARAGAPILPPRNGFVLPPLGPQAGVLAGLATSLQNHGYKALIRTLQLPNGLMQAIDTGVNGANVQIAAPSCAKPDNPVCALAFKVVFIDERQIATDSFCIEVMHKLSLLRVIPVTMPDGRKADNLVYLLVYQGEPDIGLVEATLNLLGRDIDKYRVAYRDSANGSGK
ncbi:MAG TPA: hypothetical protein VIG49_13735, partial [Acetobacteraceae bacterium]